MAQSNMDIQGVVKAKDIQLQSLINQMKSRDEQINALIAKLTKSDGGVTSIHEKFGKDMNW